MLNELNERTKLDWRECRVSGQVFADGSRNFSYWLTETKNGIYMVEANLWATIEKTFHKIDDLIKYINNKEAHNAN